MNNWKYCVLYQNLDAATRDAGENMETETEAETQNQCGIERDTTDDSNETSTQHNPNFASDIGHVFNATMSSDEISRARNDLTSEQKYYLLMNHEKPTEHTHFPVSYIGGCNRSFKRRWLKDYNWLCYSFHLDGAFCLPCALFSNRTDSAALVSKPFTKWNKANEKFTGHSKLSYHAEATTAAADLKESVDNPHNTIPVLVDVKKQENIANNRHIVRCIAESVLFCGRQCVGLRGDGEHSHTTDMSNNPGNLLAVLDLIGSHDVFLRQHLVQPAKKNCTYKSPQIQNELIEIIGREIIQKQIIDEVKKAKFYSLMADEVTSHNMEELSLCLRFVDEHRNIREEFVEFLHLHRITGACISSAIKATLEKWNLPIADMRGQGYDGASNMSSGTVGVQASIREEAPLAGYMHCSGHALNLVIASSCRQVEIRNMTDKLKTVCSFFLFSPKREGLLLDIVKRSAVHPSKRKPLIDMCRIRWAGRHIAYSHVYIVQALEVIAHGWHHDMCGEEFQSCWDTSSRSTAKSIVTALTSFEFIVCFMVVYQMLSHLSGITTKLQSTTIDILEAYGIVKFIVFIVVHS